MDPTWAAVLSRRLDRHFLTEPATSRPTPADVAAAICGVHAQIISAAELSIGQRLAGAGRDDVRAALWETRELVKTFGPRGTVHLLPTEDLPRWTGALAAVPRPLPSFDPSVRLAPAQLDEVVAGIGAVLADAELTIDELDDALADEDRAVGGRPGHARVPGACGRGGGRRWTPRPTGACSASARSGAGRSPTPARSGGCPGSRRRRARRRVHLAGPRVLRAYGPARPEHFAQWLGAAEPWAVTLFERSLGRRDRAGRGEAGAWVVAGDTAFPPRGAARAAAAAVLRRVRGGLPSAGPGLPRRGGGAGAGPAAGRQLPGAAGRRHGRRASGTRSAPAGSVDVTVEPLAELSAARPPRPGGGDRADRRVRRPDPAPHDRHGDRGSARVSAIGGFRPAVPAPS